MNTYRGVFLCTVMSVLAFAQLCHLVDSGTMAPSEELLKHMSYVNSFKCRPQPRSYLARKLLGEEVGDYDIIRPFYTILHTCDINSGCCGQGHQCSPKGRPDKLTLWFFVNNTYKSVTAYNHTQCECLPLTYLPKR